MKKYLHLLPYLVVFTIAFYLLPLIIKDTGSAMVVMLVGLPAICFITSFVYGVKNSYSWTYALGVCLIFAPTIYIYYNESAAVYIVIYGVIAAIGNLIGKFFYKPKH